MKYKLREIRAEGLKGLEKIDVPLNGEVFLVKGPNGAGKSLLLDLLSMATSRKKGLSISEPIKKGLQNGSSEIGFEDEEGNKVKASYEAHKTKTGMTKQSLIFTSGQEVLNPKSVEKIWGPPVAPFSVKDFVANQRTATGRKKNMAQVMKVLFNLDFDSIDTEIAESKSELSQANANERTLGAVFSDQGITPDEVIAYVPQEPLEISEAQAELGRIRSHNSNMRGLQEEVNQATRAIEESSQKIQRIDDEIESLRERIKQLNASAKDEGVIRSGLFEQRNKRNEELLLMKEEDEAPVLEKIQQAEVQKERNTNYAKLLSSAELLIEARKTASVLSGKLSDLRLKKAAMVRVATTGKGLPEYLFWKTDKNEDPILWYKDGSTGESGVPFEPGQVQSSAFVKASAAVSVALSKGTSFPIVVIEDASLLDKVSFKELTEYCTSAGFQVVAEVVTDSDTIEIEVLS